MIEVIETMIIVVITMLIGYLIIKDINNDDLAERREDDGFIELFEIRNGEYAIVGFLDRKIYLNSENKPFMNMNCTLYKYNANKNKYKSMNHDICDNNYISDSITNSQLEHIDQFTEKFKSTCMEFFSIYQEKDEIKAVNKAKMSLVSKHKESIVSYKGNCREL